MPDIKIISIINMKGGVGKTTLTANIGWALTEFHNKNVLLVDVDMQANLSQYFIKPEEYVDLINRAGAHTNQLTVMDIYGKRRATAPSTVKRSGHKVSEPDFNLDNLKVEIYSKNGAHLHLIPSTLKLVDLNPVNAENRLKRFLDNIKGNYDYILIDCPPTMYFFAKSALISSDAYLIPIKPDYLSSFGFLLLEKIIKQFEYDYELNLIQLGSIFTMVRGRETRLMRKVMSGLRVLEDRYFFQNTLTDSIHVAEAAMGNNVLFKHPKAKRYAEEIKNITMELLDRIAEAENNG